MNFSHARATITSALLGAILIGGLSAPAASAAPAVVPESVNVVAPASTYSDSFAKRTFDLINAERAKVGARPFAWNQRIADVSQGWAEHLGRATVDPNFNWAYIHRSDAGGSLIPAGATMYRENIGFNRSPELLVQWWMNSPGHKAAMLDPRLTDAGLGYIYQTAGPYAGTYQMVSNMATYPNTPIPAPQLAFNDIANAGFINEITWMKKRGITTGYPDGSFRPFDSVNRDQMAAFMFRLGGDPNYVAPRVSPFSDVTPSTQFYREITWMHQKGISTGWSDGTYRPAEPVTREAMAAFMQRFTITACNVNVNASRNFVDADSSGFASQIRWMGGTGISTGWSDGTYRPLENTQRKDMAAFMYRLNTVIESNGGCRI